MFNTLFHPRFYETDALGHINNTVVAGWFEAARQPVFKLFAPDIETPGFDIRKLSLILARTEIDFAAQIYLGSDVVVKTWIEKIGNSSFTVAHLATQNDTIVAHGKAIQVYFDFANQRSQSLPDRLREALEEHME